jgi:hypothetical protein
MMAWIDELRILALDEWDGEFQAAIPLMGFLSPGESL